MYTITKTNKGIRAVAIPGKDLGQNTYETFSYAIGAYGFLVLENETLTGDEWITRILQTSAMNHRLKRVLMSIAIAMGVTVYEELI